MSHPPAAGRADIVGCALPTGLIGLLVASVLPFAPVIAEQAVVTWPASGQPVVSTTALFVPYRPAALTVTVPCATIRAAVERGTAVTVLATGPDGDGLVLKTLGGRAQLQVGGHTIGLSVPEAAIADCETTIHAGADGLTITDANGPPVTLTGEPVPKVFSFHTDLDPGHAAGMAATARTASPFASSPGTVKILLIAVQLLAVLMALILLTRTGQSVHPRARLRAVCLRGRKRLPAAGVDLGVITVLSAWAIIGPLAVDDGWATTIARNFATTGNAGNYYRWWNASETPFALSQQLLAPLTEISLSPLWLRLPSTLLGMLSWFVLSRGVLGAALPATAHTVWIRMLAALCFLTAWLPFNLGARPESYVALGVISVLALLWRARGPAALGWAALIAAVTITISPTGVLVLAPIAVFAPRTLAVLRAAPQRAALLAHVALLCCVGAIGVTVIFADQTWDGLITATKWHNYFGPSLPWYHEPDRYRYLLGTGQQGSAAKRLPVVLSVVMLPVVGMLVARRAERTDVDRSAIRLAAVVVTALALLALVPSKWSYHLGAMAGLFASFLVVAVTLGVCRARQPVVGRMTGVVALACGGLMAAAAALAFAGPNAWWLPAIYDVPWAFGPIRPLGLPLDSTLFWIGVLVLGYGVLAILARPPATARPARALIAGPAAVMLTASGISVAVLLVSFLAAPMRRPAGSLAVANLHRLTGGPYCGLADDIRVLPDGDILAPAGPAGQFHGFSALGGFDPTFPPPDPPGTKTSTQLWGSRAVDPQSTATMTSPWFVLPALGPGGGVAISVSGRMVAPNKLIFEFGRAGDADVATLGARQPLDRASPNLDPGRPVWRTIGLNAAQIPRGADRLRILAVAANTEPSGWLALTGPRLRSLVALTDFLANHGPVLVNWPESFLFPCVQNIAVVADGLAEAPRAVIEEPQPWSTSATDQTLGGTFAALVPFGKLHEIPTELAGHPDIDWGALLISGDTSASDAYQRGTIRAQRPGHDDTPGASQVELPRQASVPSARFGDPRSPSGK